MISLTLAVPGREAERSDEGRLREGHTAFDVRECPRGFSAPVGQIEAESEQSSPLVVGEARPEDGRPEAVVFGSVEFLELVGIHHHDVLAAALERDVATEQERRARLTDIYPIKKMRSRAPENRALPIAP